MEPQDIKVALAEITNDLGKFFQREAEKVLDKMTADEIEKASTSRGTLLRFLLTKALVIHVAQDVLPREYGSEGGSTALRIVRQAAKRP
jgi:hypothetical protein